MFLNYLLGEEKNEFQDTDYIQTMLEKHKVNIFIKATAPVRNNNKTLMTRTIIIKYI